MSSHQVNRGYAYEYAVAHSLEERSHGAGHICMHDGNDSRADTRRDYLRDIERRDYSDYLALCDDAHLMASLLPVAQDDICFTPSTINPGEVYDIIYTDGGGNTIKVSCKTQEVVDKIYTPASCEFSLPATEHVISTIEDTLSPYYSGMNKGNLKHLIPAWNKQVMNGFMEDCHDNYDNVCNLIRYHVIGTGDYYKTVPGVGLRYYPPLRSADTVDYTPEDVHFVSNHRVVIPCRIAYDADGFIQNCTLTVFSSWKNMQDGVLHYTLTGIPDNCHLSFVIELENAHVITR